MKRNRFAIASIASGLAILFWVQCILQGHNRNMIDTVTEAFTGSLQVYKKGYSENHSVGMNFDPSPSSSRLANIPNAKVTERVYFPSILSSGEESTPVLLVGINPETEVNVTTIKNNLKEGSFIVPEGTPDCSKRQIYLGAPLLKKLGLKLGNKVVVMGQSANGSLGNDLLRVTGVFDSGSADFDKSYAFTSKECVQSLAAISGVHEQIVSLPKNVDETPVRNLLSQSLGESFEVMTWREAVPGVANMIRFNDAMIKLITLIFFTVITLGVINAMLMNVFERMKEFGVMLSLGMTPNQVRFLIVMESLVMGVVSAFLGTVLGTLIIGYHAHFGFDISPFLGNGDSAVGFRFKTVVHPYFEYKPFLKLVFIEILFIMAAGIYPAHRAADLDPVETMRS